MKTIILISIIFIIIIIVIVSILLIKGNKKEIAPNNEEKVIDPTTSANINLINSSLGNIMNSKTSINSGKTKQVNLYDFGEGTNLKHEKNSAPGYQKDMNKSQSEAQIIQNKIDSH